MMLRSVGRITTSSGRIFMRSETFLITPSRTYAVSDSDRFEEVTLKLAYLEVEPSERGFKEAYIMRYQTFARDHLEQALRSYEQLKNQLGEDVFDRGGPNFRLMIAESQLARAQLNHALRKGEQILKDKAAGILNAEELKHCAPP